MIGTTHKFSAALMVVALTGACVQDLDTDGNGDPLSDDPLSGEPDAQPADVEADVAALTANIENMPLYRMRFSFLTADGEHDGTNAKVFVNVGSSASDPNMLRMYLDKGGEDFGRGDWDAYEFFTRDLGLVGNFKYLRLGVTSGANDGWCVKVVKIFINGDEDPIYRKEWNDCKWLEGNSVFELDADGLRDGNPYWVIDRTNRSELNTGVAKISRDEWRTILATMMGDIINRSCNDDVRNLKWGAKDGDYYTGVWQDGSLLRASYDLVYPIDIFLVPDAEVDLKHSIRLSCSASGDLSARFLNPSLDISGTGPLGWLYDALLFPLVNSVEDNIEGTIQSALSGLSPCFPTGCSSVEVTNNGLTTIYF